MMLSKRLEQKGIDFPQMARITSDQETVAVAQSRLSLGARSLWTEEGW